MKKFLTTVVVVLIILGIGFLYVVKNPDSSFSQKALNMFWGSTSVEQLTGQAAIDANIKEIPAALANPASTNCVKNWWTLAIAESTGGQVGMCTLSGGTVCEERAYMRGECWVAITNAWPALPGAPKTEPVVCTADYTPVCGLVQIQCIKAPCLPVEQTFSNKCVMGGNKLALFLHNGECVKR